MKITVMGFILAIDESESSLHMGSQKRLLQLLNDMANTYQVITATHSIVFIDKTNDDNVYLIERDDYGKVKFYLKKHKREN